MKSRCYTMASQLWQEKKLKRKDIGLTKVFHNDYFVELPEMTIQKTAHCKWCALFDALVLLK